MKSFKSLPTLKNTYAHYSSNISAMISSKYPLITLPSSTASGNFYQNFQNSDIYMKDLDLPDVLTDLEKKYSNTYSAIASPHHKEL